MDKFDLSYGSVLAVAATTPIQAARAWLLAKKPLSYLIPGTTKLNRLQENVSGASIDLTDEILQKLEIHLIRAR